MPSKVSLSSIGQCASTRELVHWSNIVQSPLSPTHAHLCNISIGEITFYAEKDHIDGEKARFRSVLPLWVWYVWKGINTFAYIHTTNMDDSVYEEVCYTYVPCVKLFYPTVFPLWLHIFWDCLLLTPVTVYRLTYCFSFNPLVLMHSFHLQWRIITDLLTFAFNYKWSGYFAKLLSWLQPVWSSDCLCVSLQFLRDFLCYLMAND